jgi:DNA/RNA endonuclease YhcR with UshA esterase domain
MARTEVGSKQIKDHTVNIDDLNTSTPDKAVITKVVAGDNINIQSTGVDDGTGNVTINASFSSLYKGFFL